MNRLDAEEWAYRIVSAIEAGHYPEDSLAELKRDWPDANSIARQLGGHANSARGQEILWLLGVDESMGVVPFTSRDAARWRDELNKEFDGGAPVFQHYNLEWKDAPFVALLFHTDAAPYVVKNPKRGLPGAGPFDLEVPWREGRTRSASRAEIILTARPAARLPLADVVKAELRVTNNISSRFHRWSAELQLYVASDDARRLFFPQHKLDGRLLLSTGDELRLNSQSLWATAHDKNVTSNEEQLILNGAGRFSYQGHFDSTTVPTDLTQPIVLSVQLGIGGADLPLVVIKQLTHTAEHQQFLARWIVA